MADGDEPGSFNYLFRELQEQYRGNARRLYIGMGSLANAKYGAHAHRTAIFCDILLMLGRLLAKIQVPDRDDGPQPSVELAAAVLLFEVAWADHRISDIELATVRRTLVHEFGIDETTVDALVAESRSRHEDSVGVHRFTRALVDAWTPEQRFRLVVQLWRLALCDAALDKYEDATIRKIADLLYVSHADFITAKRRAKRLAADRPDAALPPASPRGP